MAELLQFTQVEFRRFKAFKYFVLKLRHFNILVGPNNSGKSTILVAFRILAAAMRKATARNPELVPAPDGRTFGYSVDLSALSIAEENIFYNYDDREPALVSFTLSNGHILTLYFPARDACYLLLDAQEKQIRNTTQFKSQFNCPVGFVPILGPVEQVENLNEKETARRALFSFQAARHFRNIWHYFPQRFQEFR